MTRREIVNAIWETPPPTADGSVYTYVTGLRRALAVAGVPEALVSDRPGYRLRIPLEGLDVSVFTALAGEAAAHVARGDHERGVEVYARALGLGRGEPLSGVPGPFAEVQRQELSARVLDVREAYARARLALGAHAEVAADLSALIELFPFRESLHELRMLALHQGGRDVDALELFRDTRETLYRELGSEPGVALQRLHQRILRGCEAGPGPGATRERFSARSRPSAEPPARPVGAIDQATSAISGRAQDLLRWLAVLGDDVPARQVVSLLPQDGHRLQDLVEEAVSAGVLVTDGIRIRFRHLALREIVYWGIARPFRAVMHMQAARALAAESSRAAVARQLIVDDVELDDWALEWLSANAPELGDVAPDLAARLIERVTADCRMSAAARERLRMVLIRALSRLDRLPESIIRDVLATAVDPVHIVELHQFLAVPWFEAGRPGSEMLQGHPSGNCG